MTRDAIDSRYPVLNPIRPEIKDRMLELGRFLKGCMPDGYAFALLIFNLGDGGFMNYLSSADRQDMIKALKEMVQNLEGAGN